MRLTGPDELPDLSVSGELDVWANCPHCSHGTPGQSAGHRIVCRTCGGVGITVTSYQLRRSPR